MTATPTNEETTPPAARDMAGTQSGLLRIWGIPVGLAFLGGFWSAAAPILWPISFLWIGAACTANALHCRRVHCTIMGPSFLVLALMSIANAAGVLTFPWDRIGQAALVVVLVAYAPEFAGLKYFRRATSA